MNGKRGRQVLAMKYIIRRIVALLTIATIIAVPAAFGAYSYERDKNDNHNQIDSESNTLSYDQVEPHVRTYLDEEKLRVTSEGAVASNEDTDAGKPPGDEPDEPGGSDEPKDTDTDAEPPDGESTDTEAAADVPVYDTPSSVPDVATGTVLIYAGEKIPDGFLLCDGREVPRGKYQSLYKIIGEKYGEGDGVTTFNLPDMNTLAARGIVGTVASGDITGDIANVVSAALGQMNRPLLSSNITAELAFEQTGVTPAYKLSEPSGPPPTVDQEKLERNAAAEEKPESNPTAKGDKPAMYFIIKY
jgi:microcystin-dependent protein